MFVSVVAFYGTSWKNGRGGGETTVSANQPVLNLLLLELESSAYLASRKLQIYFFPSKLTIGMFFTSQLEPGQMWPGLWERARSLEELYGSFCTTFTSSYLRGHQERACLLRIRGWRPLCHRKVYPGGNVARLTPRSPEPRVQFYSHTWKALGLDRQFLSFWKRKPAGLWYNLFPLKGGKSEMLAGVSQRKRDQHQVSKKCHVFLRTRASITHKFEIISDNYLKLTVAFIWKTFRGGSDKEAYL